MAFLIKGHGEKVNVVTPPEIKMVCRNACKIKFFISCLLQNA